MKLMILAQPKTASTSLMHAVGSLTDLSFAQFFQLKLSDNSGVNSVVRFRDVFPALGYPALSFFHSDIASFSGFRNFDRVMAADVCKQHLPPTKANIDHLQNVPKVVLVRKPHETIESYRRVTGLGLNIQLLLKNEEFCQHLEQELEQWQRGWLKVAEEDSRSLVLTKDDLVERPVEAMANILSLMGFKDLEIPSGFELPKKRYSGG